MTNFQAISLGVLYLAAAGIRFWAAIKKPVVRFWYLVSVPMFLFYAGGFLSLIVYGDTATRSQALRFMAAPFVVVVGIWPAVIALRGPSIEPRGPNVLHRRR